MPPESLGNLAVVFTAESEQFIKAFDMIEQQTTQTAAVVLKEVEMLGAAVVAVFAAMAEESVREWSKLDDAMTNSVAVMGGVSEAQRQIMEDTARSMAKDSVASADELAGSYAGLAAAGNNVAQATAVMASTDAFATANRIPLSQSTEILSKAVNQLGLSTSDTAGQLTQYNRVSDVFTAGARLAHIPIVQFAEAFSGRLPAALRTARVDLETAAAAMIVLSNAGLRGHEGTAAFTQTLQTLQRAATSAKQTWSDYGVTVFDLATGKMLPLSNIMGQLRNLTEGMSDSDKKATLQKLGFAERTVTATRAMIDNSDAMQGYIDKMHAASGVTESMAEIQLTAFSAQMKELKHQLDDVEFTLGEALAPTLEYIAAGLKNASKNSEEYTSNIQAIAIAMKGFITVALAVAMTLELVRKVGEVVMLTLAAMGQDTFQGWKLIFAGLKLAMYEAMDAVSSGVTKGYNAVVEIINKAIAKSNDILHTSFKPIELKLTTTNFNKQIKDAEISFQALTNEKMATNVALGKATDQLETYFGELVTGSTVFDKINAKLYSLGSTIKGTTEEVVVAWRPFTEWFGILNQLAHPVAGLSGALEHLTPDIVALRQQIEYPWDKAFVQFNKLKDEYHLGTISADEFRRGVAALNMEGSAKDPFKDTLLEIDGLRDEMSKGIITATQYEVAVNKATKGTLLDQTPLKTGDTNIDAQHDLIQQKKESDLQFKMNMESNDKLYKNDLKMQAAWQKNKDALTAAHDAQRTAANQAQAKLTLDSASEGFGSLLEITGTFFKKSSGIYQAMFIAQKAFAIASAMVNIAKGISDAATATPWWMKIPAMASVAAATASIVSNIAAVATPSFEGGGDTPDGPRSGGLDGRGGFMALLHPNEHVTDLTKNPDALQRDPSGMSGLSVAIHNYGNDKVTAKPGQDGRSLEIMVNAVEDRLSKRVRSGGSSLPTAFEQTYRGLKRGAT